MKKLPHKDQLKIDCDSGLMQSEMAIKYGVSRGTICKTLKMYGFTTRPREINPRYVEKQAIISQRICEKYSTAEYKKRQSEAVTPEQRLKTSNRMKAFYSLMDRRIEQSAKSKLALSLIKDKLSKASKDKWANPEYRQKTLHALHMVTNTDKFKINLKNAMVKVHTNPEFIKNHKEAMNRIDIKSKMAIVRQNQLRTLTRPHLKVCSILDSLNIIYETEKVVGPHSFDVFIPSHSLLIEVQGDYWHSLPKHISTDQAKSTYVKEYFPQYQLKYVWEHECLTDGQVLSKLKHWLGLDEIEQVEYNFKDTEIKSINNVKLIDSFLYNYHYQHHGRHGLDFGCYLEEELIAVARFASVGRKESAEILGFTHKEVLELARLCVHPKYQRKNLLSWFLSRIEKQIKEIKPEIKCLISFADRTYGHTGAVYKASNWELNRVVEPNYWYVDQEGWVMHKKTLWNHSKKMCLKESEYATKYGYTKVWGKEKLKFIKRLI